MMIRPGHNFVWHDSLAVMTSATFWIDCMFNLSKKNVSFQLINQPWDGNWDQDKDQAAYMNSLCTHSSYIVNTTDAADDITRASVAIVLTYFWGISAWIMSPVVNGLTRQEAPEPRHVSCPWAVPMSHLSLCNGPYRGIGAG